MVYMNKGNLFIFSFSMKKFIRRLLIFLLPVIGFITWWEYGLSQMQNSYTLKKSQLEEQAPSIQVLVLGPSHALRGVDPDCFSIKGYNAANFQQSLFYDTRITLKYLDKMPALRVVLIDISYPSLWFQVHDCEEPMRDYFYSDYWKIKYPLIKWYDIRNYSKILQVGNENAWGYAMKNFKVDLAPGYLSNGWAIGGKKGPITDSAGHAMVEMHEKEMKPDNYATNINDLIMFIKELQKRNIQPIFFIPPFSNCYNKYMYKSRLKTIDSTVDELCKTYQCKWYDFHDDTRFCDSNFREVTHLNKGGAIKFSKIIDEEILKKINLPNAK